MREEKSPAVYIMASGYNGTLYIGVTSALWNRVATHKAKGIKGFTSDHDVQYLVWYEHHHTMEAALKSEKRLKKWLREWKINLIEKMNPNWKDLHDCIDVLSTLVELKEE